MVKPEVSIIVWYFRRVVRVQEQVHGYRSKVAVEQLRFAVLLEKSQVAVHFALIVRVFGALRVYKHEEVVIVFRQPEDEIRLEAGDAVGLRGVVGDVDLVQAFVQLAEEPPVEHFELVVGFFLSMLPSL